MVDADVAGVVVVVGVVVDVVGVVVVVVSVQTFISRGLVLNHSIRLVAIVALK